MTTQHRRPGNEWIDDLHARMIERAELVTTLAGAALYRTPVGRMFVVDGDGLRPVTAAEAQALINGPS